MEQVSVHLDRVAQGRFRAENERGASIEVGLGDDVFTPVELLLAALGACSSIDPDAVISRRMEPESFSAEVSADYVREDENYLRDVLLRLAVELEDSPEAHRAARVIERALAAAHGKTCTVARTLERRTEVQAQSEVSFASGE